jgi:hypothetical protein
MCLISQQKVSKVVADMTKDEDIFLFINLKPGRHSNAIFEKIGTEEFDLENVEKGSSVSYPLRRTTRLR